MKTAASPEKSRGSEKDKSPKRGEDAETGDGLQAGQTAQRRSRRRYGAVQGASIHPLPLSSVSPSGCGTHA